MVSEGKSGGGFGDPFRHCRGVTPIRLRPREISPNRSRWPSGVGEATTDLLVAQTFRSKLSNPHLELSQAFISFSLPVRTWLPRRGTRLFSSLMLGFASASAPADYLKNS